ncbi:MAG: hypothetical protein IPN89_10835 [Saprospiraceae bacterium]|nr:hypothetical protein [Saprospiraceae bacterium]
MHESFMVADKKAPTPVCIPLSTALMQDPDGIRTIVANGRIVGYRLPRMSYDNCTDK